MHAPHVLRPSLLEQLEEDSLQHSNDTGSGGVLSLTMAPPSASITPPELQPIQPVVGHGGMQHVRLSPTNGTTLESIEISCNEMVNVICVDIRLGYAGTNHAAEHFGQQPRSFGEDAVVSSQLHVISINLINNRGNFLLKMFQESEGPN
mmetsp:Transcript_34917/g.81542  ORF Transcript_34917/g.81542 Transcript_34917/m.81542 type:complete len:149 (+) Transcript_34917:229-675(+)